ncbi:hypothetical protein ACMSX5_000368 [Cronobacter turicensis]|uniref:Uncharacterized protein n=1 Tax=Cronobacter turicensis (strain DSM 18703 / CCUG 55852 / LMG 23827 / z3032) TaxID=693216 RepID=C9XW11_CROTZ|nr:hypothetical protein [Cronobacter turicensis]CBA32176.1 unknown protein [Cronobacter turicensis z3032]EKM0371110.1 hypothetical protein [Cronobacter turicensis]EKM0533560.1 hypothetical protein [Cronobacter turicensis]ELQ6020837.1 hypothetical protein [Cronobacter turicensis]ELQ6078067.1 hypothetical protein [Cronobacter turicensis]
MFNYLKKSLQLGRFVENDIKNKRPEALERLKTQLKEQVCLPTGWRSLGMPLVLAMVMAVLSFAIPQVSFWVAISQSLGLPGPTFFIGMLISNFLFCVLIIPAMIGAARGSLLALQLWLTLAAAAVFVSVIFFISVLVSLLSSDGAGRWDIIGSLLGILFSVFSVRCINSRLFMETIALGFYNRILREQAKYQAYQPGVTKR